MKKILLSSIVSVLLCATLIAGATFALFTSEKQINVAVNSATVSVSATVEDIAVGTTLKDDNGDMFLLGTTTATFNAVNGTITFEKIVPGDYVTFNIVVTNGSNVPVNYRTTVKEVSDDGLLAGLTVTIGGQTFNGTAIETDWAALTIEGTEKMVIPVTITLPEAAGNEYQTKALVLSYLVEAVQGNAKPARQ